MFDELKRFVFGDKRPVVRSVVHPIIGVLIYSDDDEAWFTDPKVSSYGFGFYISGDWNAMHTEIRPAAVLLNHAAEIASQPAVFVQSVREFLETQLQTVKSLARDEEEVRKLQVYRVNLMWPERPNDGEIELRSSLETDRMWHCAYVNRKPAPYLTFSGLAS
jgi:hypothetical protein